MGKASALFNGVGDETLYKRITPSAEQREFLQVQWNALADHLKLRLTANTGYPISTWLQGSYKYGTLIRPVHKGEEYDVDVGVYFEWRAGVSEPPSALQLRKWVQREMVSYMSVCSDLLKVDEPPKERCSRAVYAQQFHIDTPVYHLEPRKRTRRLACLSGQWEESDPKAFYRWFKGAVDADDREQVRRLVRYLKGWAAVAFDDAPSARPSSILLTVLIADAFKAPWLIFSVLSDDDALIGVLKKIYDRLVANSVVPNPVDRNENLNRIERESWSAFIIRLRFLRDAAVRADEAEDEVTAALAWSETFSFLMPLPTAAGVEYLDDGREAPVLPMPDIDIEVYSERKRQAPEKFRNAVFSVPLGRKLRFTIANPIIIPDYATVEWTLRNDHGALDTLGDLGCRKIGIQMFSMDTLMSYAGQHFVDCVIRVHGQVYAVRRVPVSVSVWNGTATAATLATQATTTIRSSLKGRMKWI